MAAQYERRRFARQFLLLAVYGLSVYALSWGWAAGQLWSWDGAGKMPIPGVKVLILAPFFVGLVVSWVFAYDADRALYVAANRLLDGDPLTRSFLDGGTRRPRPSMRPETSAAAGPTSPSRPGRSSPWSSCRSSCWSSSRKSPCKSPTPSRTNGRGRSSAVGVVGVFAVLLTLPWMVRLALGLKPLPPGPTRDRLLAAAKRLRFRCSDVLLWNTRGSMANAMVIGVLPWPRYVIFTDRFLEEFNGDEVEAVFGHEVGHVKHQHMVFYLAFLLLSMAALGYGCIAALPLAPGLVRGGGPSLAAVLYGMPVTDVWMLPAAAGLLAYIFVVFGFLSRRCERQADVYGCRAVSCGRSDCVGHDGGVELAPRAVGLCPTGVRTFIYALEKVAQVNGISRDRPGFLQSWQHGSIARRVGFLYGLLKDPSAEPRFQRRVALVKWGLIVVLGALLAALLVFSPPTAAEAKSAPNEPPAGAAAGN